MKRILALLLVLVMFAFVTGCSEVETNTDTEALASIEETTTQTKIIVYEDDYLVATYVGISDVAGQIGMSFSLENKCDQELMVLPLNCSINDVMVQFVSGIPATIQPGKTFNQVWMANPQVVGVSEISEVNKIEFTLTFGDIETETITINP